ncbi:hypothetical protein DFJ74DRAFT_708422 [Hyaloraphidium curvatum]|nr:hypothetical protein DFJ74DRAFT_708422 [Hyaloraphidium curvatum]
MGNPAPPPSPTFPASLGPYPSESLWERAWEFHGKHAPGVAKYLSAIVLLPPNARNAGLHPAVLARLAGKFAEVRIVAAPGTGPLPSELPGNAALDADFAQWENLSEHAGLRRWDVAVVPECWEALDPGMLARGGTFEGEGVLLREIRRLLRPAPEGTLLAYSHPFPLFHGDQKLSDLVVALFALWYPEQPPWRSALERLWDGLPVARAWTRGVEERWEFPTEVRTPLFAPERYSAREVEEWARGRPEWKGSEAEEGILRQMLDAVGDEGAELEIPCMLCAAKYER